MRKKDKEKIEALEVFVSKTLESIGENNLFNYLAVSIEKDLQKLDKDIRDEQQFAKENPPRSTYGSAGTEARQRAKYLKRVRKEHIRLIRKFNLIVKMKNRIDKMW